MSATPTQQLKKLGMAALIAAFAYQPAMQASMSLFPQPSPTAPGLDTLVAATPTAGNVTATTQLAQAQGDLSGSFISAAHPAAGTAQIVEDADGQRYLSFDEEFVTDAGPDLFVLLHRESVPTSYDPEQYINLGQLSSETGAQQYAIPDDVSLADIQSAVIWCRAFNVTFSYAAL